MDSYSFLFTIRIDFPIICSNEKVFENQFKSIKSIELGL